MNKLNLLIRQNKKKIEIENCKHALGEIMDIQLQENDFLSLEQTDLLTSKFYLSYKTSDKLCNKYLSTDLKKLEEVIKDLCLRFNKNAYLIIKQTETCGLIKISATKALERYKQFIKLDGDSLCLLMEDESEGIYLDYFEDTTEQKSRWFYEVCLWKV